MDVALIGFKRLEKRTLSIFACIERYFHHASTRKIRARNVRSREILFLHVDPANVYDLPCIWCCIVELLSNENSATCEQQNGTRSYDRGKRIESEMLAANSRKECTQQLIH